MNTAMWRHPITRKQIQVLEQDWGAGEDGEDGEGEGWITVLRPMEKELACGDVSDGAMIDWRAIVVHVGKHMMHEGTLLQNGTVYKFVPDFTLRLLSLRIKSLLLIAEQGSLRADPAIWHLQSTSIRS
jgi:hypothetical protein